MMSVQPIHTAPPEQTTAPKEATLKDKLSATDWKTYCWVVVGYFLIAVGIALACATAYFSVVVHPMLLATSLTATPLALGSVTAVALGVLCVHASTQETTSTSTSGAMNTRKAGEPPGLQNAGANCFMNAVFQLACNLPAFQKRWTQVREAYDECGKVSIPAATPYFSLKIFLDAATTYINERVSGGSSVSKVNTQSLREWLFDATTQGISAIDPISSRVPFVHEDAFEFLKHLLTEAGHTLPVIEETQKRMQDGHPDHGRVTRTRLGAGAKPKYYVEFALNPFKDRETIDLDLLFNEGFFNTRSPTSDGLGMMEATRRFESVPQDFTLQVDRTCYREDQEGRTLMIGRNRNQYISRKESTFSTFALGAPLIRQASVAAARLKRAEGYEYYTAPGGLKYIKTADRTFLQVAGGPVTQVTLTDEQIGGLTIDHYRYVASAPDGTLYLSEPKTNYYEWKEGEVVGSTPLSSTEAAYLKLDSFKLSTPLDLPMQYQATDAAKFGGVATYACDGFVVHRGESDKGGHYVSYSKDADGRWWHYNDSRTSVVTEEEAAEALRSAYIIHYQIQPAEKAGG